MLLFQSAAFAATLWERLVSWYHRSAFRELITYLDDRYSFINIFQFQLKRVLLSGI